MKIEKKETYSYILSDEKSFKTFFSSFKDALKDLQKEHIILHFLDDINISKEDFSLFLDVSAQKKENGTSFVIIYKNVNVDDIPETINIVPTLTEAIDVLEMEAMERELGF